jgi:hypothetical protein
LALAPWSRLLGGRHLSLRDTVLFLILDLFLLIVAGSLLTQGRARRFFFHLMPWSISLVLVGLLEVAASNFHLAHRIAPFEDLSLLDNKGRWPAQLLSDDRFGPSDRGLRVYRPWQGDGIFINELGLRTASPTPKSPGEWRVAISGGSTVWGWRVLDADTIPADIQRLLRPSHPRITVFNFGIEGATLATELLLLKRFREVYALDQVVFYTGANDAVYTYLNATSATGAKHVLREEESAFALVSAAQRLNALLAGTSPETLAKLDAEVLPRALQGNSLARGITAAHEYCLAAALRCDFALQPILQTRKTPVGPEIPIIRTLELVYPRMGTLTEKMYAGAIETGPRERIRDLTPILDTFEQPFFVDLAHVNEAGNRLAAAAILPILLQSAR